MRLAEENLSLYQNLIYHEGDNRVTASLINYYCKRSEWVFLHGLPAPFEILLIKRKFLNKIIWRTWGHDIYDSHSVQVNGLRSLCKKYTYKFADNRISKFKAIGVSNIVDRISVSRILNKGVKFITIPYPSNLNEINKGTQIHDGINILLGHSGYPNDNHIYLLRKLERYKNEGIHVFTILSYGDPDYIGEVEAYIEDNWAGKATIIKKMLPYDEYVKFLSGIDLAIMDGKKSYALGNLFLLINLQKKIILNRDGVLAQAFDEINLPYLLTNKLGEYSPDELFSQVEYKDGVPIDFRFRSFEENKQLWKELLSFLR